MKRIKSTIAVIAAVVALGSGVVYGAVMYLKSLDVTMVVIPPPDLRFYSDAQGLLPLPWLDLGGLYAGSTNTKTVYVKNASTQTMQLTFDSSTLPANIGVVSGDFGGLPVVNLNATQIIPLNLVIVLADAAPLGNSAWQAKVAVSTTIAPIQISYAGVIQPILNTSCTSCHGSVNPSAGIRLTSWSYTSAYVIGGNATGSRLYRSLLGTNGVAHMPPSSNLSSLQISQIAQWINDGALNN